MKNLKRFSAVAGALAVFAVAFTSCGNVTGTEINFAEKEQEILGKTGIAETAPDTTIKAGNYTLNSYGSYNANVIRTASKRTTINVNFTNSNGTKINKDSAVAAISFSTVSENEENYWKRGAALPATVVAFTEGTNDLSLEYEVDTSSVTTNRIAVVADATKLKDKYGNYILNGNGNYKAGEASDSKIVYLGVRYKADNTATEAITKGDAEWFAPSFDPFDGDPYIYECEDSSYRPTGKYQVRIWGKTGKKSFTSAYTDIDNFAAKCSEAIKLRVREPESTSTKDVDLTFEWKSSDRQYESQEVAIATGSRIEVWRKKVDYSKEAAEWTSWYETKYGHPVFLDDVGIGATEQTDSEVADVFAEEPDYIVESYNSTATEAVTWYNKTIYDSTITTAQRSFVDAYWTGIEFYVATKDGFDKLEFAADPADFKVIQYTSSNHMPYEIPFKVTKKLIDPSENEDHPDRIAYYRIEITDKNISVRNPELWIGSGVALKAGSNVAHPKQLKFGKYKNVKDGILSGYVQLY